MGGAVADGGRPAVSRGGSGQVEARATTVAASTSCTSGSAAGSRPAGRPARRAPRPTAGRSDGAEPGRAAAGPASGRRHRSRRRHRGRWRRRPGARAHQQHRALVVVGEHGAQARLPHLRGDLRRALLRRTRAAAAPPPRRSPHARRAGARRTRRGPARAVRRPRRAGGRGSRGAPRDTADLAVVHEQRVRAVDRGGSQGDDGPGAGPLEQRDPVAGPMPTGASTATGRSCGPGAGRVVAAEADAAVLHDRVVQAAERPLQRVEEAAVERADRDLGVGMRTMRVCPARRLRAAACGT